MNKLHRNRLKNMDLELSETVGEFILAKIEMTECMQKHFRQVCGKCTNYVRCKKYNRYVECWMNLQKVYLEKCSETVGKL